MYSYLVVTKFRLIQAIDLTYDMFLYKNRNMPTSISYVEDYNFIIYDIYYFINDLLMYSDDMYINKNYGVNNISVYIDNTIKKIYIATYYKLTNDKRVINLIKNNELYGVNKTSSSFLDEIIIMSKKKIKN